MVPPMMHHQLQRHKSGKFLPWQPATMAHFLCKLLQAIQIFQHTFRNCALVIDLDFIADSLAESRNFPGGLHHLSILRSQSERRYWGQQQTAHRKISSKRETDRCTIERNQPPLDLRLPTGPSAIPFLYVSNLRATVPSRAG